MNYREKFNNVTITPGLISSLINTMNRQNELIEKLTGVTPSAQTEETTPPPPQGDSKKQDKQGGILKFTKKELDRMPAKYKNLFAYDSRIITFRFHNGVYEARYRRDGFNIEVSSKQIDVMKEKFIQAFNEYADGTRVRTKKEKAKKRTAHSVTFAEYGEEWLKIKQMTTKSSTYKEYERVFLKDIKPALGNYRLDELDRSFIQEFLFSYVEDEKYRTAEKLKLQLSCIFDMAADDFGIASPMKKIVLPHYESKQSQAFTLEEEHKLVDYCIANRNNATSSALLVLLYFGLRQSELKSLEIIDGKWLQCETSKERMGKNVVLRKIPITPAARKVIGYIDFDKARDTNTKSIQSTMNRLFPEHHPHELRHTFISRCKTVNVNAEVVSILAGHSLSGTITTTVYTHYSEDYQLKESEKVNYEF